MAKAKEKLSPIPRPRKRVRLERIVRRDGTEVTLDSDVPPPGLDHVAVALRPLAVPLSEVSFMVGNPRSHPESQIEELKASLLSFGQVEPLIVNQRAVPATVIGGNGRLQAMLSLGWTHAAVVYVDLDQAKANALAIVLNRTQEGGSWDAKALEGLLANVDTGQDERLNAMLVGLRSEQVPAQSATPPVIQHKVVVICRSEEDQKRFLEELTAGGRECRALNTRVTA